MHFTHRVIFHYNIIIRFLLKQYHLKTVEKIVIQIYSEIIFFSHEPPSCQTPLAPRMQPPWRSLFLLQASAVKRYTVQPHLQISKTIAFVKCCMETKDISRTPRWKKTHDASFGAEIRQNVWSPRPGRHLKFRVRYFLEFKSFRSPRRRFLCLLPWQKLQATDRLSHDSELSTSNEFNRINTFALWLFEVRQAKLLHA